MNILSNLIGLLVFGVFAYFVWSIVLDVRQAVREANAARLAAREEDPEVFKRGY